MACLTRKTTSTLASFGLVAALVGFAAPTAEAASGTLPGGTPITNTITSPATGSTIAPPGNVTVQGTASIAAAAPTANTTLIYVIDESGSTSSNAGCGGDANGDGSSNTTLDCEAAAALALNTEASQAGSPVDQVGVIDFSSTASVLRTLTTPGDPTVATAIKSVRTGGDTNFLGAVQAACTMAQGSTNPITDVVFLSDGYADVGGNALTGVPCAPKTATFKTFAVGTESSCTNTGTGTGSGSLQQIAAATGASCTTVSDPTTLSGILTNLIQPKLLMVQGTIDGGAPTTLTTTPATPANSPITANYSWNVTGLGIGSHNLCTIATGSDTATGTVKDCVTVNVVQPIPVATIGNVSQLEGNTGLTPFTFNVTLDHAATTPVTVNYATADGTATLADNDYQSTSGTLTFPAGTTSEPIVVNVVGDLKYEANETFKVNLSAPSGLTLGNTSGTGTIVNDDSLPMISINDVSRLEGDTGTSPDNFTVSLSNPSATAITVKYATSNGTATAPSDYLATSGTLTFPPGATSEPIVVQVVGDYVPEADETFNVNLSAPTGATIARTPGVGTIINDDRLGTFACQATGLRLGAASAEVANSAYSPCLDGTGQLLNLPLNLLVNLGVKVVTATTNATPNNAYLTKPAVGDSGQADSKVTGVNIGIGGHTITADAVTSHAEARCVAPLGGTPTLSGSTVLTNLRIDGKPVTVTGYASIVIPGVATVYINRTDTTATGVTQRAIWVQGTGLLAAVSVVVGEARAGFTGNPCAG